MKKVNPKMYDVIGIAAGILLVLMCILAVVINNQPSVAGAAEIPDSAVTAEGTAQGRNGPITVSVTADENTIYQIEVLSHEETEGIGTVAATEMPGRIFDTQSLQCDMVSGATISSEAIVAAVADALKKPRWRRPRRSWSATSSWSAPAAQVSRPPSSPRRRAQTSSCSRRCPSSAATASAPRAA